MKTIGIIAEYNPFHNGHAYQIQKIKQDLHADFVIVAMSGDFVQRGTPAILDKYTRTQMALSCGADLVLELPVLWATASAESFAMAGITLFDKMGCVDGVCFGAETEDFALLSAIADILVSEPKHYRTWLSYYLKNGFTFPAARSKALYHYYHSCHDFSNTAFDDSMQKSSNILHEPNNILAIEYFKALKRRNSSMTPYIIKRQGAGYHEEQILDNPSNLDAISVPTASATAIRKALKTTELSLECRLDNAMPPLALNILTSYLKEKSELDVNDFSSILGYKLLTVTPNILADVGDSNLDLANRIYKNRMSVSSFEQFCELNKSKDITYTRISRILLHLLLEITNQDYLLGKHLDYIPYLRILGFRKESSALLKTIKTHTAIPMLSKLADASSLLKKDAMALLEKDIFAANLYEQVCGIKRNLPAQNEYTRPIIRL